MTHSIKTSEHDVSSLTKFYTVRDLAQELGVSKSTIARVLDDTENLGYTVKVAPGKPTILTERHADFIRNEILSHKRRER